MTDTDPAAASTDDTAAAAGSSSTNGAPRKRAARKTTTSGKTGPKAVSELDGVRARLEGVEPVVNNAFHASGAALLLSVLALGLAIFLLFRIRGLAPAVAKAATRTAASAAK